MGNTAKLNYRRVEVWLLGSIVLDKYGNSIFTVFRVEYIPYGDKGRI